MKSNIYRILAIGLTITLLSACTLTTTKETVKLSYSPSLGIPLKGAESKPIGLNVLDKRGRFKGRISVKDDGFGNEMADITSTVPVQEFVRKAFVDHLNLRKIKVDNEQGRNLLVSITAFHNAFHLSGIIFSARGIVTLTVKVINENGVPVYERLISKVHVVDGFYFQAGELAAQAIEEAFKKSMIELFATEEFISALDGA